MENFAWSIVPRADKLAAAICGRFDVNPARLILIEQHDTSWPWWVVPMLGRHADRRYWVATAKDGKHRWDSEPADKRPWRSCSRGTWRKREFGYGKTESR